MLPYSTDWFMTWQPNIHSSLFHAIYRFIDEHRDAAGGIAQQTTIQVIVKSYRLYLEHMAMHGEAPALSLTRAWTLVRYFDSGMLQTNTCTRCGGRFVAHAHDCRPGYVCGLCQPPSRAGKTKKSLGVSAAPPLAA
jgi:flagellar transcriptional activator FlhC